MIHAHVVHNLDFFLDLESIKHSFDMDRLDLGRGMMSIATTSILVNMDQECDPDGNPWNSLSVEYHRWKTGIAPGEPMGVLYGHMKTREQIEGEQNVTTEIASMEYGIDPIARNEAIKFTYGGIITGTNQPPRPFYGLTLEAILQCNQRVDEIFEYAW